MREASPFDLHQWVATNDLCNTCDGVFEAGSEAGLPVRFHERPAQSTKRLTEIQGNIRRRLLCALTRRGLLEPKPFAGQTGNFGAWLARLVERRPGAVA